MRGVIMPRGSDQLLLPVNPLFLWFTLLLAFAVNLVPVGRVAAMPDLMALTLVFWNVHQPRRVGIGGSCLNRSIRMVGSASMPWPTRCSATSRS